VIVHRIELQQSERELLEMAAASYSFNRVMTPIVAAINDNTTLLLILTTIAGWLGFKYIIPEITETLDLIEDFQRQYEAAKESGFLEPSAFWEGAKSSFMETYFGWVPPWVSNPVGSAADASDPIGSPEWEGGGGGGF
jgi:hypothetical protein